MIDKLNDIIEKGNIAGFTQLIHDGLDPNELILLDKAKYENYYYDVSRIPLLLYVLIGACWPIGSNHTKSLIEARCAMAKVLIDLGADCDSLFSCKYTLGSSNGGPSVKVEVDTIEVLAKLKLFDLFDIILMRHPEFAPKAVCRAINSIHLLNHIVEKTQIINEFTADEAIKAYEFPRFDIDNQWLENYRLILEKTSNQARQVVFVKKCANLDPVPEWDSAYIENRIKGMRALYEAGIDVNAPIEDGMTALEAWYLNEQGSAFWPILKILLEFGADINRLSENWHLLSQAVSDQKIRLVRFLLENGANPNVTTADGQTPLSRACQLVDYRISSLLIEAGAKVNSHIIEIVKALPKDDYLRELIEAKYI